jgi:hypothetical protein
MQNQNEMVEVFSSGTSAHRYSQERRHSRVPVDFLVSLRWPGMRLADRAIDLSESGVQVLTVAPLHPMTLISMRLELPHSDAPIDLLGRVMWTNGETMGIRFESNDPRLSDTVMRLRAGLERV